MPATTTKRATPARRTPPRDRSTSIPRRLTPPPAVPLRVSAPQLIAALNHALAEIPECAAMRIGARDLDAMSGADGDWSESGLLVRVHGTVGPRAFKLLRAVLTDARARYTLMN
ncbi:MAG TPA: hypothetical protein VFU47_09825 [Armatimonadota bacterium]|nr:hypothetical protein [Armatimonadota bacterium]